jgi:hypothetical protein
MLWSRSILGLADNELASYGRIEGRATYRSLCSGFSRTYTLGMRGGKMIAQ